MDRRKLLNEDELKLFDEIQNLHQKLNSGFKEQFNRSLPLNETLIDRWQRAKELGFGAETSIYDSALVIGNVKVGKKCWIGPFTVIDGSGDLTIGDSVTISVGVHIYTHDNVKQTLSGGKLPIERSAVVIGNCSYVGPQTIIAKGISIGNYCVIAANSFINKSIPDNSIVAGNPGKVIGKVIFKGEEIVFEYDKFNSRN